jgi:diguanylate cyclase (GGDEF)-like protein/PAS domain S-box-containing protein
MAARVRTLTTFEQVLEAVADDALAAERERARLTLDSIGDAVIGTDSEGRVAYLNATAEKMTGWSREEARGRPLPEVFRTIDADTREAAPNPVEFSARQNSLAGLPRHCILVRRDGFESAIEDSIAPIHDRDGNAMGAVMVVRDVSEARRRAVKLSHLANHDPLTDLPNRMLLRDRLDQAIALARRHRRQVAVLYLDLDHFKHINDSLGHAVGDQVLQEVSRRLSAAVRRSDTVSRQGGDEFVILLSEVEHTRHATRHAEKIQAALSPPHIIAEHELRMNVSIGISVFPADGHDAETLVACADAAMYDAKASGRNAYRFFAARPKGDARLASSVSSGTGHLAT